MKKIRRFLASEDGVMVSVEAVFLYPFTILLIFVLIYIGLYLFEGYMVQNYAQKLAVTAAREIAMPGYTKLAGDETEKQVSVFGTPAVDWNVDEKFTINIETDTSKAKSLGQLYRNFGSGDNLLDAEQKERLTAIGEKILEEQTILKSSNTTVVIEPKNYFVTQQVTVTISEDIEVFGVAAAFGFDANQVSASAVATAGDPDQFIRDVDTVGMIVSDIFKIFHIDINSFTQKFRDILDKFNAI